MEGCLREKEDRLSLTRTAVYYVPTTEVLESYNNSIYVNHHVVDLIEEEHMSVCEDGFFRKGTR